MILSKNRQKDDILFIDASQSYKKDKKQNVLRESDVQRIFDTVVARKDVPNYAHLATMEEIERNILLLQEDAKRLVERSIKAEKTLETLATQFHAVSISAQKLSSRMTKMGEDE